MYIDANTLIWCSSIVGAIAVLCNFVFKFVKWAMEQKEQTKQIQEIKEEQTMFCYVCLACLDGLKQLGANGEVTKAHDKLNKYINRKAHDQKGEKNND